MSEPKQPTAEQPAVDPTVSTDPGRSRWQWSGVPSHVGPARTSTVVLGVLFLAIGALYLNIRPDTAAPATTGADTGVVEQPATPTPTAPPTTAEPTTTPESTPAPSTSPTTGPTDTTLPTDTTVPSQTASPTSTSTSQTLTTPTAPVTSPSAPTP